MFSGIEYDDMEVDDSSSEEHMSSEDGSDKDAYANYNDAPVDDNTIRGMTFASTEEANSFYKAYGRRMGFKIRKCHTDRRNNIIKNMKWECSRAGFRKPPEAGLKRIRKSKPDTKCGCKVCFRIALQNGIYKVTTFVSEHNHELEMTKIARKAKRSSRLTPKVTETYKRNFEDIQSPAQPTGPTLFSMGSPHDNKSKCIERRIKVDHRTSLPRLCGVNATLHEEQRKAVESMGFSSMLKLQVNKIDLKSMQWLLKNFDPSTHILDINGKKINITVDMVKSTIGIPCSGEKITKHGGSNIGVTKYNILFQKCNGEAIKKLVELEHKVKTCTEHGTDFKILYMMFLCATVLLPKHGAFLDLEILEYLVDIDNIYKYNWGELVLEKLVEGVDKYKRANVTNVTGCIFLLQVIFVTELTRMLPNYAKIIVSTQPYVEQWTQDEVSNILQMFETHIGYEESLGSGGTSDIGTKKTQDKNNQQPFHSSDAARPHSHDHTQPYVKHWTQDEVSDIVQTFETHTRYEGSLGSGGTSNIGTKKPQDKNNQQPFHSPDVARTYSHDHTQPYVRQGTQDEVSNILQTFETHTRYEGSLGSGGTSNIGMKKPKDKNNQQPFQSSDARRPHSHDHTLLKLTADQIQLMSNQMDNVEGAVTQLLSNMSGTYTSHSNVLLEYMADRVEMLCGRMSSVQSVIQKVKIAKTGESQDSIENFKQNRCTEAKKGKPISLNQQTTQGKEMCGKSTFEGESNAPSPNMWNKKHKVFKERNSAALEPYIRQEPQTMQGRTKNLIPCILDFESVKANKHDSSKKEDVEDIFLSICKVMPKPYNEELIDNLISMSLDESEMLVDYGYRSLTRHELRSLNNGQWLWIEVLNCVAYLTWCERQSCPGASRNWNIPTWFAEMAQGRTNTDEHINQQIFGPHGHYRSSPSQCSTISIPIYHHPSKHFLLCKVDIDKKIIEICDTLRSEEHDRLRLSVIENAVIRLESVSKLWGDESFRNSNWHTTFKYQYCTTLPRQTNGYNCGIYVCLLMMFPQGVNRALTEEESVSTRRRLALKLYTSKENRVYDRNTVTIWGTAECAAVTRSFSRQFEIVQENAYPANLTVVGIEQMIAQRFQFPCEPTTGVLTLSAAPTDRSIYSRSEFLVTLQNDDELQNYVQHCLDVGVRDIQFIMT